MVATAELSRGAVVGRAPSNGVEFLRGLSAPLPFASLWVRAAGEAPVATRTEEAVAPRDCSVPVVSSRDVAKWEPIPVAFSAEDAIH